MRGDTPNEIERLFADLCEQIAQTDFGSGSISDRSRNYLNRNIESLRYYARIYAVCLKDIPEVSNTVLVDYGGGCAFLSQFAKCLGVAKVIYVDINPESVQTAEELKRVLGIGPDVLVNGDSRDLKAWCIDNNVVPDCLVSVDVIEHIYDLDTFFADLLSVNPSMKMVFTTASNHCNWLKARKLRKVMLSDEQGRWDEKGFYAQRLDFIRQQFPQLAENELEYWARNTRGLAFDDIEKAVAEKRPNTLIDRYNTCDPATGSWTERVLPLSDYKRLFSKYKRILCVENGFCDTNRTQPQKAFRALLNGIIRLFPHLGRCIAPFIILKTKY